MCSCEVKLPQIDWKAQDDKDSGQVSDGEDHHHYRLTYSGALLLSPWELINIMINSCIFIDCRQLVNQPALSLMWPCCHESLHLLGAPRFKTRVYKKEPKNASKKEKECTNFWSEYFGQLFPLIITLCFQARNTWSWDQRPATMLCEGKPSLVWRINS